jgi:hypothetical protein
MGLIAYFTPRTCLTAAPPQLAGLPTETKNQSKEALAKFISGWWRRLPACAKACCRSVHH